MVKKTDISLSKILNLIGLRKTRYYDWMARYGNQNLHNGHIPDANWIMPEEKASIINYFLKNPLNGCKRLSYMMIDEDVAYVSPNTVNRVLKSEGLLNPSSLNKSKKGTGFSQPDKPHQHWHIDISYINAGGTFYYLCSILDGYSRFIVNWDLKESMKEEDIQLIIQRAREGSNAIDPIRLISDNGSQFKAKEFKKYIKHCEMEHVFTSPYYPQSNGKIERWHKELKNSKIRPKSPRNYQEAKMAISEYIEEYNYKRLHSAIDYVTPYDKLLGLEDGLIESRKHKLNSIKEKRTDYWKNHNQAKGTQKELACSA